MQRECYDARNATWLSEDPVEDVDSPNLYAFVAWKPHMAVDPEGKWLDTALDVATGLYDVYRAAKEFQQTGKISKETQLDLALDVLGVAAPGITALSLKGGAKAIRGMKAVGFLAEHGDELSDVYKGVRRLENGVDGATDAGRYLGKGTREVADVANDARDLGKARQGVGASTAGKHADDALDGRRASKADDISTHGPSCNIANCFARRTIVKTVDGPVEIQDVQVGDRVVTTEDSEDGDTEVDPELWKLVRLRIEAAAGQAGEVEITLLRAPEWFIGVAGTVGGVIWFDLPESGVAGWARVESIEPCPPIADGPGRVVIGTITLYSERVVEFWLEDIEEPLQPTAGHSFYSVSRNRWLRAEEILPGEELWSIGGPVRALEVVAKPGIEQVFNLEIEQDHIYFVTDHEILSHNSAGSCSIASGKGTPSVNLAPANPVKEFDILPYNKLKKHTKGTGFERHHGVLDAWAEANVKGYKGAHAPTIVLSKSRHDATRRVLNRWRAERGMANTAIDWSKVSAREMNTLAHQMLDAAGVPAQVQRRYLRAFNRYIYGL